MGPLRSLCLGYPQGLGAFCDGPEISFRRPRNPLYFNHARGAPRGMATFCRRFCRCINLAPGPPAIQEATVNREGAQCASDADDDITASSVQSQPSRATATTQCSHNGGEEPAIKYSSHYKCDGSFYGHPNSVDCKTAIRRLPDWGVDDEVYREYFEFGDPPDNSNSAYVRYGETLHDRISLSFHESVKAPFVVTSGTCTVAVLIPEDPPEHVFVRSKTLIGVAETLESKCVSRLGSGGKFDLAWDTTSEWDRWIPHIIVFGKSSLMESWLDLILRSRLITHENPKSGSRKFGGTGPVPKGSQQACSGSCMDPNDCNINSDCICASNKPIPLSSTWGQHACTYVAGAALALAQNTPIRPSTRCRGRCLDQDDNTTDLLAMANMTKTTIMSFNTSLAKLSKPWPNTASSDSASVDSAIPPIFGNDSLLPNNFSTSLPSDIQPSNRGTQDLFSTTNLTCPCNCTYVSPTCCLSHIVWENPRRRIKMDLLPANATVYCDANSGKWLPKSSESVSKSAYTAAPAESDSAVGFIELGSVRVNTSAAVERVHEKAIEVNGGFP